LLFWIRETRPVPGNVPTAGIASNQEFTNLPQLLNLMHRTIVVLALAVFAIATGCKESGSAPATVVRPALVGLDEFSFALTADMREFTGPKYPGPRYFEGACAALASVGPGDFMISPGDIDPIPPVRATLDRFFGSNYVWYPVIGNHEAETPADIAWLHRWSAGPIPGLVRQGPPTCKATAYSFDHGGAHFAVLNQYCDEKSENGAKGDVLPVVHDWLAADLAANTQPVVFVVGHEPIVAVPDMHNRRVRHKGDSLDAHPKSAKRFVDLLRRHRVTAYLTAHTHNTSVKKVSGVWQIDCGHARGLGDKGARSTFMKVRVGSAACAVDVYRANTNGLNYALVKSVKLN
jgi:hypothetical protein